MAKTTDHRLIDVLTSGLIVGMVWAACVTWFGERGELFCAFIIMTFAFLPAGFLIALRSITATRRSFLFLTNSMLAVLCIALLTLRLLFLPP